MSDRRGSATRWGVGVVVATAVMLALPAALVAAQPTLATPPSPPSTAPAIPSLPASQPGAPASLDSLVAHGPFIATGFSDARSNAAAAEVRALDPRDAQAAQRAFVDAWYAMPADDPGLSEQFAAALMAGQLTMNSDPPSAADQAMLTFTGNPDNAARLANAAVALFVLGVAEMDGAAVTDQSVGDGNDVEENAAQVLELGYRAFSPDAPQYLQTLSLDLGLLTPLVSEFNSSAVDALEAWLSAHPSDVTVRDELGTLLGAGYTRAAIPGQVSPTPAPALAAALQVLTPLQRDARTAALGYSAEGDAEMREAHRADAQTPYLARQHARAALDDYDAAIRLNRDPGLLAGRAVALDFLGDEGDAVAAQRKAVVLAPHSAAGLVALAALQQKLCDAQSSCDESAVESTAKSALDMLGSGWHPRVDAARFPPWREPCLGQWSGEIVEAVDPGDDRGTTGYSYGSLDDVVPVMHRAEGCGAGGAAYLTYALVPTSDDPGVDARHANGAMLDTAASLAIQAAALRGATADADSLYQAWRSDAGDARLGATAGSAVWKGRQHLMSAYHDAAHLVTAPAPATPEASASQWPESLVVADSMLRHAGRFAQAARVCQASVAALPGNTYPPKCAGEADYLAGDARDAQRLLTPLYASLRAAHSPDEGVGDDLLAVDLHLQDYAAARSLIASVTADATSEERLGEVAMDTGDLRGAEAHFAASLQGRTPGEPASLVAEAAHSDHGIVLLREIQPAADATPECTAHRSTCEAARTDFVAASDMDPGNPVFLLNLAWADRLLDFPPGVTESVLRRALAADPTLYPAFNDLGVLEAEQGETGAARDDFARALAAAPQYDLAAWNLGVLDMRGLGGIPAGQALLASAASRNPVLRGESTAELRTDERVYKVALGKGTAPPFNRTYGVATAVLGGVSLGALALGTVVDLGKEHGRETVIEQVGERARRFAAVAERRLGGALRGMRARPWMVTAPVVVGLTAVVTAWSGQGSGFPAVLIAAYAALLGLLVHEAGHVVAAWVLRRRVRAVQSPLLLGIAVVMLPLRLLGGPCVGHEVIGRDGEEPATALRRNQLVYWAGPAANLLVALAAGLAAIARPLPMLRVILLVQLGMVGFSFLPVEPMEGSVLGRAHRRLVAAFLVALVVVAILFSEGVL